jgi:hypothetical protein
MEAAVEKKLAVSIQMSAGTVRLELFVVQMQLGS